MALKVCAEPGCPSLQPETRCKTHRAQTERKRGTKQQRGYDAQHDRLRASWQARIDAGVVVFCWRCKTTRIVGRLWHLGHDDEDRSVYRGPECVPCNTATASRRISRDA